MSVSWLEWVLWHYLAWNSPKSGRNVWSIYCRADPALVLRRLWAGLPSPQTGTCWTEVYRSLSPAAVCWWLELWTRRKMIEFAECPKLEGFAGTSKTGFNFFKKANNSLTNSRNNQGKKIKGCSRNPCAGPNWGITDYTNMDMELLELWLQLELGLGFNED